MALYSAQYLRPPAFSRVSVVIPGCNRVLTSNVRRCCGQETPHLLSSRQKHTILYTEFLADLEKSSPHKWTIRRPRFPNFEDLSSSFPAIGQAVEDAQASLNRDLHDLQERVSLESLVFSQAEERLKEPQEYPRISRESLRQHQQTSAQDIEIGNTSAQQTDFTEIAEREEGVEVPQNERNAENREVEIGAESADQEYSWLEEMSLSDHYNPNDFLLDRPSPSTQQDNDSLSRDRLRQMIDSSGKFDFDTKPPKREYEPIPIDKIHKTVVPEVEVEQPDEVLNPVAHCIGEEPGFPLSKHTFRVFKAVEGADASRARLVTKESAMKDFDFYEPRFPDPSTYPTIEAIKKDRPPMDVNLFLKRISTRHRDVKEFADKFESFDDLLTVKGIELKKRGIPIKPRRWILRWREKYRQGIEPGSNEGTLYEYYKYKRF